MSEFEQSEKDYHELTYSGKFMSSHAMAAFLKSPRHYQAYISTPKEQTAAMAFGTACHKFVLEGSDAFLASYQIGGEPINEKTGEPYGKATKAYAEWLKTVGKPVVSCADFERIGDIRDAVFASPAGELLTSGKPETVIEAEIEGVMCHSRYDWLNDDCIVDLKTTADITDFERQYYRMDYDVQMAFYRMLYREVYGVDIPVYVCAVQVDTPIIAGCWRVSGDEMDKRETQIRKALRRFAELCPTDVWESGFENLRYMKNPWA